LKKNLIYGYHAVLEALEAEKDIDKVLFRKGLDLRSINPIREGLRERQIPYQFVPDVKLETLCPGRNHQGILAFVSSVIYQPLEEVIMMVYEAGQTPLFILPDGVTDVRNMGAIARSAEGLGAQALIVPMQHTARMDADAVKTSAGALNHLPVCRTPDVLATLDLLKNNGIQLIASSDRANKTLFEADYTAPTCILLGAEDTGLSSAVLRKCDNVVAIPMFGKINSLNVSVASGILLMEAQRQRLNS
jgi:23S rRNA (guanosine2251-2'-O)-methyltransferase